MLWRARLKRLPRLQCRVEPQPRSGRHEDHAMKDTAIPHSTDVPSLQNAERAGQARASATQVLQGPRLDTSMNASLQDLPAKSKSSLFDQLYLGFADKARAAQASMRAAAAREDWALALSIVHRHRSDSGFLSKDR